MDAKAILKGDQVCESHMRTGAGQKSNKFLTLFMSGPLATWHLRE